MHTETPITDSMGLGSGNGAGTYDPFIPATNVTPETGYPATATSGPRLASTGPGSPTLVLHCCVTGIEPELLLTPWKRLSYLNPAGTLPALGRDFTLDRVLIIPVPLRRLTNVQHGPEPAIPRGLVSQGRLQMVIRGRHVASKIRRVSRAWAVPLALTLVVGLMASAMAAVTFDPATGTGFVGKGDVQQVYGWNNKALQDNAGSVQFRAFTVETSTWLCRHTDNPNAADQERSTTTTTEGVVSSIARERNQITGFNLTGYDGDPTVDTDGALNSCPNPNRDYVEGSTETEITGGGVQVSIDGTDWITLP